MQPADGLFYSKLQDTGELKRADERQSPGQMGLRRRKEGRFSGTGGGQTVI
jgi:hypothetical protein